jgi:hypothetical protein
MTPLSLFAQAGGYGLAGTVGHYVVLAIVIAGIIGILYVGLQQAGVAIPPFIVTIFWIVVCVVACVIGVHILLSVM